MESYMKRYTCFSRLDMQLLEGESSFQAEDVFIWTQAILKMLEQVLSEIHY